MKNILSLTGILMLVSSVALSQNLFDAYRLSTAQYSGTARSAAMGNAFGALGGDFTSLSINPAGIGLYRTSELVVTPRLDFSSSELSGGNSSYSDSKFKMNFNNIGFVSSFNSRQSSSDLVGFNLGIGINRLSDFNNTVYFNRANSGTSFLDNIVTYSNSEGLANAYLDRNFSEVEYRDWPAKLAWDTYLINPYEDGQGTQYDGEYVNILYEDETVNQKKRYDQSGGINEMVLSAGMNFAHKLYIGATFGFTDINVNQVSVYSEEFGGNSFDLRDDFSMVGNGYSLKLGVIYKPIQEVRLGFAFHTPTIMDIRQINDLSMESYLQSSYSSGGSNEFDYTFNTPSKFVLSGAAVFGKSGLIDVDLEYLDYSKMRFRNKYYDMTDLNTDISDNFNGVLNLRIGGEYKLNPVFALRAGYEMYGNPYKYDDIMYESSLSKPVSIVGLGLGYSTGSFFADLAYRQAMSTYRVSEVQPNFTDLSLENNNGKVLMTLGFRF